MASRKNKARIHHKKPANTQRHIPPCENSHVIEPESLLHRTEDFLKTEFALVASHTEDIEAAALATTAGELVEIASTPFLTPLGGIAAGAVTGIAAERLFRHRHELAHTVGEFCRHHHLPFS